MMNNNAVAQRFDSGLRIAHLKGQLSNTDSWSKSQSIKHRISYYKGKRRLMTHLIDLDHKNNVNAGKNYGENKTGKKYSVDFQYHADKYLHKYHSAWKKTGNVKKSIAHATGDKYVPESQRTRDIHSAHRRFSKDDRADDISSSDKSSISDLKKMKAESPRAKEQVKRRINYLNFEGKAMHRLSKAHPNKNYGKASVLGAGDAADTPGGISGYEREGDEKDSVHDARRYIPRIKDAYRRKYHLGKYASNDQKFDDKSTEKSVHDDKSTSKKPQDRKRKAMQSSVAKNGKQASAGSNASNNGNSQSAKSASSQASMAKSQSSKASSAQSSQARSQSSATRSRASSQSSQVKSQSSATKSRASSQSSMAKSQSSRAKSTSSSQARSQSSAAKSSTASSHSAARSASRSQSTASKAQVSASQKATSASKASVSKSAKSNRPASSQAKQSSKPNNKNVSQSASHKDINKQSAKSKSQASGKSKPTSKKSLAKKVSPAQKREKKAAKNPYISKPSAVHHYKKAAVAGAAGTGAMRARKLHDIKHYRGELANKRDYGRGHFKTQKAYQGYVKKNASHYAISPKSGQIVPKNLTQHQQSGIRRKMLADQRSLGLGRNRPQTQQPAPETHTNPFVNKGATATSQPNNNGVSAQHTNPFVNKSVQQQAPSGQTDQNQPQAQQNPAMRQFDANHPLAGRFIQRIQQDFGEGNGVDNQVQQAQQDAGMQSQNNPVSQFGQRAAQAGHMAAQTAQNVGHQAVQQPAAHALGQQATQAAAGLAQNRPQASQNPGLANALQRGLSQDRNNVAAQNTPQSNPQVGQGAGTIHTPNTQQQSAPQAQQSTPQPSQQPSAASQAPVQSSNQTAQLGGNNLIHSQIAQSQTAAQQQPSGPQQGGSQQSGPQV